MSHTLPYEHLSIGTTLNLNNFLPCKIEFFKIAYYQPNAIGLLMDDNLSSFFSRLKCLTFINEKVRAPNFTHFDQESLKNNPHI